MRSSTRRGIGRYLRAAIGAAVIVSTVAACGGSGGSGGSGAASGSAKVLRVGTPFFVAGPEFHLDPRVGITGNENTWLSALYAPVMKYTASTNTFEPNLAKSVTVTSPTSVDITLRDDAKFDNGAPVTAADAKATLDAMLANLKAGKGRGLNQGLALVDNVKVTADKQYTINFSAPAKGVVYELLAGRQGMILPAGAGADQDTNPIGNGPFKMKSLTNEVSLKLVKSSTYFDAKAVTLAGVEFRNLAEGQPQMNALLANDIDLTSGPVGGGLTSELLKTLKGRSGVQGITFPGNGFAYVDMCKAKGYLLNDVRVRQAIQFGTDREALAQAVYGDKALASGQVWSRDNALYDPAIDQKYGYDPEKAKQLLADAGIASGSKVKVVISSAHPAAEQTMLLMKEQWAKIGLDLEVSRTDDQNAAFYLPGATQKAKFDATYNVFSRPPSTKVSVLFTPGSLKNACNFVDQKIVDGYSHLQGLDPTEPATIAAWKSLDDYIASINAVMPLMNAPVFAGASNRVKHLSVDTLGPIGMVGPNYTKITMN
jgi:peptide/nickel transport system substrate-binding protein